MSYDVGTHIDLRHLNKEKGGTVRQKKSLEQATRQLCEVGTQFIFWFTSNGLQTVIKIPAPVG